MSKQYNFPTVTLSNGLVVANFSSNHSAFNAHYAFKFNDGNVLDNCSPEHSKELSLEEDNIEELSECMRYTKVKKEFNGTEELWEGIESLPNCDIVLVSYPMLLWAKETFENLSAKSRIWLSADELIAMHFLPKMATCYMDRQTKLCSIDKFCF